MAKNDDDQKQEPGWHGDPEEHGQEGQKGGETTKKEMDDEFYQQVGREGGKKRAEKTNMSELGEKGGEAHMDNEDED